MHIISMLSCLIVWDSQGILLFFNNKIYWNTLTNLSCLEPCCFVCISTYLNCTLACATIFLNRTISTASRKMLPHEVCSSPKFSGLTTALSNGSMSIPDIIHSPRFFTLGIENNKTDSTINHDTYSTGWKWDMKQDTQAKSKSKKKLSASLPLPTMSPILKCHMYFKNNNNKKKNTQKNWLHTQTYKTIK